MEAHGRQLSAELEPLRDADAARVLGVSPATLPAWRCRGQGPRYLKIGGRVVYLLPDLLAWRDAQAVDPRAAVR